LKEFFKFFSTSFFAKSENFLLYLHLVSWAMNNSHQNNDWPYYKNGILLV